MAEYIEREALIAAYDKAHKGSPGGARKLMEDAPAVDVMPLKHGRWVQQRITSVDSIEISRCSLCGYPVSTMWRRTSYCPNCGCKMDLED